MIRYIPVLLLLLLLSACGKTTPAEEVQAAREREFQNSLSKAALVGHFTMGDRTGMAEDKYLIEGITKLTAKTWLFRAHIGDSGPAVPIPITVEWAGDTPVVSLTDLTIPGMGTFTARVLFYRGQYAGTWSGKNAGGQLFGKVVKQ